MPVLIAHSAVLRATLLQLPRPWFDLAPTSAMPNIVRDLVVRDEQLTAPLLATASCGTSLTPPWRSLHDIYTGTTERHSMHSVSTLPPPLNTHWDWQRNAACRGMDVTVFFQPDRSRGAAKRSQEARAKAVCATCPVRRDCLNWAIAVSEPFGVWGGTSPEERDHLSPRHAA